MFLGILRMTWRFCVQSIQILFNFSNISIYIVWCSFIRFTLELIVINRWTHVDGLWRFVHCRIESIQIRTGHICFWRRWHIDYNSITQRLYRPEVVCQLIAFVIANRPEYINLEGKITKQIRNIYWLDMTQWKYVCTCTYMLVPDEIH